jgi:hypothetical protein
MPYVHPDVRKPIDRFLEGLPEQAVLAPGILNYTITKLCLEYLGNQEIVGYSQYNEVIGVLECAKLEMYRRIVALYEDDKKETNGDVY